MSSALAQTPKATTGSSQPSVKYTMPSGKGWTVCESYLSTLRKTAANDPPLCETRLDKVPGASSPNWEELDPFQNLALVHQIELVLGVSHIEPRPESDFEAWQKQFAVRTVGGAQKPRLRRTHLQLAAGGPMETVLSYDQDVGMCQKEIATMKRGGLFRTSVGEPNFFVFDERTQRVLGGLGWISAMQGTLWLHSGSPYYVALYVDKLIDPSQSGEFLLRGYLHVNRLRREVLMPEEPLYDAHELCVIQFEYQLHTSPSVTEYLKKTTDHRSAMPNRVPLPVRRCAV